MLLARVSHHQTPAGPLLGVLIVLVIVYVAWRTGRLRRLRSLTGAARVRSDLKGVRVGPLAFVPLALLLIVIVLLLVTH